jgi:hypothetical protein
VRACICYTAAIVYSPDNTLLQDTSSSFEALQVVIRESAPLSTIQGLATLSLFLQTRHQAFLVVLEAPWLVWRPTSGPDAL